MRNLILPLFVCLITVSAFGQPGGNIVPNSNFNMTEGKVKGPGAIEAAGWKAGTEDGADLFWDRHKAEFNTERNMYGGQIPDEGEGYAGILTFSDKDQLPRTYIQTPFAYPMNEGVIYCIKFYSSLSDLSKYAANGLGAYVSAARPNQKDLLKYDIEPQIRPSRDPVATDMSTWTATCQLYEAKGGEGWLTIGNFMPFADIQAEKQKKAREFMDPQKPIAYYYIDMVTVVPIDSLGSPSACQCEQDAGGTGRINVVYRSDVSANAQLEAEKEISLQIIYFDDQKTTLREGAKPTLDKVAELMKKDPAIRVEVMGHSDKVENLSSTEKLSEKRAQEAFNYLVAKGIAAERLTFKGYESQHPATPDMTPEARSKNKRVQFRVLKE